MDKNNVNVQVLAPMRVVSAHGFGTSPEAQAWDELREAFDAFF